jgi:hypothetical protein
VRSCQNEKKASREQVRLGPLKDHIDRILEEDREAQRKQQHTARRIYTRLREEHPEDAIGEPTVRRYVAMRKSELGLDGREVYGPQSYQLGQEAQVDWFEAIVGSTQFRRGVDRSGNVRGLAG